MKVKLINVRLSFPDLFTATQFDGKGAFTYGASFLMPPKHPAVALINAAIMQEAQTKWATKAAATVAAAKANPQKCCFVSGDTKDYDGYAGNLVLSAKRDQTKGAPLVFDHTANPVAAGAPGCPYAGCYCDASVDIWMQDNGFGKAIRATLLGVQFRADGDAFAAGAPPDPNDFADLSQQGGAPGDATAEAAADLT